MNNIHVLKNVIYKIKIRSEKTLQVYEVTRDTKKHRAQGLFLEVLTVKNVQYFLDLFIN